MKSFWERRQMIRAVSFPCFAKVQDLPHYKRSSINLIILNVFSARSDSRQFVRTLVKARFATFLVMMLIQDFGQAIARNTLLQLRRVTIVQHKDRWNFNNYYTLKNSA